MTNILTNLTAIIHLFLVTNTTIELPRRLVAVPCPDGLPGCLAFHDHYVDVENATNRFLVTRVYEDQVTVLPALGITVTNQHLLLSEESVTQVQRHDWFTTTNTQPIKPLGNVLTAP